MHVETIGNGPDLVLVHGWGMHAGMFAPLAQLLASEFTLHLVDLPGHGRSDERTGGFALQGVALRIAERVPRAAWLGWSLGGQVCLEAALALPERVQALALVATSPRFVSAPDWPHGVDAAVFDGFARDLQTDCRDTLERFLALTCRGSDRARSELRALRGQLFAHGEPSNAALVDGLACLLRSDLRDQLRALRMPSLWIAGSADALVPVEAMHWAVAVTPEARLVRIEGAGHAPFVGKPEVVRQALLDFLAARVAA